MLFVRTCWLSAITAVVNYGDLLPHYLGCAPTFVCTSFLNFSVQSSAQTSVAMISLLHVQTSVFLAALYIP